MTKLTKGLLFTDIHFGKKQNSDAHNQQCIDFINFVCNSITSHKIDHIIFLGDYIDTRNSVNISTLNYAYNGCKLLNSLNIPIFFIIGNHDLYTKHSRDVHSAICFNEFNNFTVINDPVVIENIGSGALLCPYLFHSEYSTLKNYDVENVYGHFEFNNFVVTGTSVKFVGGPDHTEYTRFKRIFSGHFHKRQITDNVIYIGNTFPMDFSDANTEDRGFAIHDHDKDVVLFVNWADCPRYVTANLSDILDGNVEIPPGASVRCTADISIDYTEMMVVKNSLSSTYQLNSIVIEEQPVQFFVDDVEEVEETRIEGIDDSIITMLSSIDSPDINNDTLIQLYRTTLI
jgi:DNA repair exonuclease SbcCD nuclease subunit